ncbi:MAG: helix-turn-helix transcriptional regulator [Telluria sp.]
MTQTMPTPDKAKQSTKRPSMDVANYISAMIDLSQKSQKQIAEEVGFAKPNMITMIKQGKTKLPIGKVGALARSLGLDPQHLFKMVMEEYEPATWEGIESIFSQPFVSENEMEIILTIRDSGMVNPKIQTDEDRIRLLDAVSKFGQK